MPYPTPTDLPSTTPQGCQRPAVVLPRRPACATTVVAAGGSRRCQLPMSDKQQIGWLLRTAVTLQAALTSQHMHACCRAAAASGVRSRGLPGARTHCGSRGCKGRWAAGNNRRTRSPRPPYLRCRCKGVASVMPVQPAGGRHRRCRLQGCREVGNEGGAGEEAGSWNWHAAQRLSLPGFEDGPAVPPQVAVSWWHLQLVAAKQPQRLAPSACARMASSRHAAQLAGSQSFAGWARHSFADGWLQCAKQVFAG